ncbi:MAG: GNAT family N-acetyltransferase [Pirellulales bacterium]|nr:GNAT family N-acetyltransferase [Pirellulales bacterium]
MEFESTQDSVWASTFEVAIPWAPELPEADVKPSATERQAGKTEKAAPSPALAREEKVAADLPDGPLRVEIVRSPAELRAHLAAWERLAEMSLEPNVFYEPALFLPAWESIAAGAQVEVALVFGANRKYPAGPPVLCGMFPLDRRRTYHGIPCPTIVLWHYVHCFLCTPLVRRDFAAETFGAFLDWVGTHAGAALVQWKLLGAGGDVERLLVEELHRRERPFWITDRHTRAVFRPAENAEAYAQAAMPRKRRHELRRLERRLAEQGQLEYALWQPGDDLAAWLDEFLELEACGWKGRQGTAIACRHEEVTFFRNAAEEAVVRGRLMLLAMRFQGRSIAMKCNFLSHSAGFAFKVAFDESYASYSPGTLLEIENIARLHERPDCTWMDSCAIQDHPMINRLWHDRRTIASLWFATGRAPGDLLLASSPLFKWAKRKMAALRPRRNTATTLES